MVCRLKKVCLLGCFFSDVVSGLLDLWVMFSRLRLVLLVQLLLCGWCSCFLQVVLRVVLLRLVMVWMLCIRFWLLLCFIRLLVDIMQWLFLLWVMVIVVVVLCLLQFLRLVQWWMFWVILMYIVKMFIVLFGLVCLVCRQLCSVWFIFLIRLCEIGLLKQSRMCWWVQFLCMVSRFSVFMGVFS